MTRALIFSLILMARLWANPVENIVAENIGGFVAGTIVHTFTGPDTIQNIRVGDRLLSFDLETGKVVESRVTDTHQEQVNELARVVVEGEEFYVNPEHRFYVADTHEWVVARNLQPGLHVLLSKSKKHLAIDEVELIAGKSYIYDLTVEDTRNYFVGEHQVLVHNIAFLAMIPLVAWGAGGLTWTTIAAAATGLVSGVALGLGIHALVKALDLHGIDAVLIQDRGFQPGDRLDGDRARTSYPVDIYVRNQGNAPYQPPQRPDASKDEIAGWAKNLGYDIRVSPDKLPFDPHGGPGFKKDDRNYISYDKKTT